jgi:hypothetical protein
MGLGGVEGHVSIERQMIDASRGRVDPIDMMSERVEICFVNRLDGPRYGCRLVVRQLSAIMTAVNSGKTVIVTNCTARKRGALELLAMTPSRLVAPTDQVARQWVEDLRKHPVTVIPVCYYAGRGYGEAKIAAEFAGARRAVVSAGMGLVWSDANLPAYDVTISGGSNTVADHLASRGEGSSDWWRELTCAWNDPQPFTRLMHECPEGDVLIAMPSTYLRMIQSELAALSPVQQHRLRIFSSPVGLGTLPDCLQAQAMPYDDRLEGTTLPGTRNDFPQRALRHFVEILKATDLETDEARDSVSTAMAQSRRRTIAIRTKCTDTEIIELLRSNWQTCNGVSSRLLRYLRDVAGVACAQDRFKMLWHEVRVSELEIICWCNDQIHDNRNSQTSDFGS